MLQLYESTREADELAHNNDSRFSDRKSRDIAPANEAEAASAIGSRHHPF